MYLCVYFNVNRFKRDVYVCYIHFKVTVLSILALYVNELPSKLNNIVLRFMPRAVLRVLKLRTMQFVSLSLL